MDQCWIDNLARLFGRSRNRRAALGVGIGAALMPSVGRRAASAQDSCATACVDGQVCVHDVCLTPCLTDRDCRSKKKDDPCEINTCVDGYCVQAIADCQPGYECCRGECCPKTCIDDNECAVVDPCRIGRCGEGICIFDMRDPCLICETAAECDTGGPEIVCCEGMCKRPCPSGTIMSKGCECRADSSGTENGLIVRDDASG